MAQISRPALQAITSLWALLLWGLLAGLAQTAPAYNPRIWNSSCNYTVTGIPAPLFFARTDEKSDYQLSYKAGSAVQFPLSPAYRLTADMAVTACFGPGERLNETLVAAGIKMPCGYSVRDGKVNYWEENACRETITNNCYCYAINKLGWDGGYCMPGYRKEGDDVNFASCIDAISKVKLDGAVPVSRRQVYSAAPPAGQHYIAMVIWPEGQDYHFFRRDAGGIWSHKRGDTFATNTFINGSRLTDVQDPAILGSYKEFCGYFLVNPNRHLLTASYYAHQQSFVDRLADLQTQPGMSLNVTRLPHPSRGWAKVAYRYYLMGLDTAVFESQGRHLPWQRSSSLSILPPWDAQQQQQDTAAPPTAVTAPGSYSGAARKRATAARAPYQHAPWQQGPSNVPTSWSLDRRPAARTFSSSASVFRAASGVKPHWMSHIQPQVPARLRDEVVRAQWHGAAALPRMRSRLTKHVHRSHVS